MATELTPDKPAEASFANHVSQPNFRDVHVVTIEDGEDGMLVAKCSEIDVVTQGKTDEELQHNVLESVELMREELGKDKDFSIEIKRKT